MGETAGTVYDHLPFMEVNTCSASATPQYSLCSGKTAVNPVAAADRSIVVGDMFTAAALRTFENFEA